MNCQTDIRIEGKATVKSHIQLSDNEIGAAQHMAELVANFQLLSVDTHKLDQNIEKFQEIADKFGLTLDRTKKIFKSLKVEKLKGNSNIGPIDMQY